MTAARRSMTSEEGDATLLRPITPINWSVAVPEILSVVKEYLEQSFIKKGDGYNRAKHIETWLKNSEKANDPQFCFVLVSAIFSIRDPNANRASNLFRLLTHSYSKRLVNAIANTLIHGHYSQITSCRTMIKCSSTTNLSSTSFTEDSLRDSIASSMGQSYGSEMESTAQYDKAEGVRWILRDMLSKMPKEKQAELMKQIRQLETDMIKQYQPDNTAALSISHQPIHP